MPHGRLQNSTVVKLACNGPVRHPQLAAHPCRCVCTHLYLHTALACLQTYRHALAATAVRVAGDGVPYLYTYNLACRQEQWEVLQPMFKVRAGWLPCDGVNGVRSSPTSPQHLHSSWVSQVLVGCSFYCILLLGRPVCGTSN